MEADTFRTRGIASRLYLKHATDVNVIFTRMVIQRASHAAAVKPLHELECGTKNLSDYLACLRVEKMDPFRKKGEPNLFMTFGAACRVRSSDQ